MNSRTRPEDKAEAHLDFSFLDIESKVCMGVQVIMFILAIVDLQAVSLRINIAFQDMKLSLSVVTATLKVS